MAVHAAAQLEAEPDVEAHAVVHISPTNESAKGVPSSYQPSNGNSVANQGRPPILQVGQGEGGGGKGWLWGGESG